MSFYTLCVSKPLFNVIWVDSSSVLCCQVTVIVTESETFEFVFPNNEESYMPGVREVNVMSQGGASVLIPIKPLVLGEIPISVKAVSAVASDKVIRKLLVKVKITVLNAYMMLINAKWLVK